MTPEHFVEIVTRLSLAVVVGAITAWTSNPSEDDLEVTRSATFLSFAGALMLCVVEDQLARAFGLMGAASVVRYRHRLRKADDASALIIALSLGMACGAGLEALAIVATIVVRVVASAWGLLRKLPGMDLRRTVHVEVKGRNGEVRTAALASFSALSIEARLIDAETKRPDDDETKKPTSRWVWEVRLPPGIDELALMDDLSQRGVGSARIQDRTGSLD